MQGGEIPDIDFLIVTSPTTSIADFIETLLHIGAEPYSYTELAIRELLSSAALIEQLPVEGNKDAMVEKAAQIAVELKARKEYG